MDPASYVGSTIANRFELLSIAGRGGMGTVFKARQIDLNRIVAVKILDPLLVSDVEISTRFQQEAKALSRLSHIHINGFLSYGILETGVPYIVIEFLEGNSLRHVLSELSNADDLVTISPSSGPSNSLSLSPERALNIALQVASALQYAHESGLVHRDLKPENIILLDNPAADFVKIVDFGLARDLTEARSHGLTKTGELIGTPKYLSPEQCRGLRADARSDIYSFACIIYEMLYGAPPFDADNPIGILSKHIREPVSFPSHPHDQLSLGLKDIIERAMAKEPDKRFSEVSSMESDLKLLRDGKFDELSCRSPSGGLAKKAQSTKALLLISVGLIIVLMVAGLFLIPSINTASKVSLASKSLDSLVLLLKDQKDKPDGAESQKTLTAIEAKIRAESMDEVKRASHYCELSEQFLAYPAIANRLALDALIDLSDVRVKARIVQPKLPSFVHDFAKIPSNIHETSDTIDAESQSKKAELRDRAVMILIKNNFRLSRKALGTLLAEFRDDRLLNIYRANYSYLNFLIGNAERMNLPPLESLENLYFDKAMMTVRLESPHSEVLEALEKHRSVAEALYGKGSVQALSGYASVLEPLKDDRLRLIIYRKAIELTEAAEGQSGDHWVHVWTKIVRAASVLGLDSEVTKRATHAFSICDRKGQKALLRSCQAASELRSHHIDVATKHAREAYTLVKDEPFSAERSEVDRTLLDCLVQGNMAEAHKFFEDELKILSANLPASGQNRFYFLLSAAQSFSSAADYDWSLKASKLVEAELKKSFLPDSISGWHLSVVESYNALKALECNSVLDWLLFLETMERSKRNEIIDVRRLVFKNAILRGKKNGCGESLAHIRKILLRLSHDLRPDDKPELITAFALLLESADLADEAAALRRKISTQAER